jgi:hypothetical protein
MIIFFLGILEATAIWLLNMQKVCRLVEVKPSAGICKQKIIDLLINRAISVL